MYDFGSVALVINKSAQAAKKSSRKNGKIAGRGGYG
jgi:hypothetical protein